jgi:hypothetical protein
MFISFKGRECIRFHPDHDPSWTEVRHVRTRRKDWVSGLNSELLRHHAIRHQLATGKSPEDLMGHLGLRRLGNIARHSSPNVLEASPDKAFAPSGDSPVTDHTTFMNEALRLAQSLPPLAKCP